VAKAKYELLVDGDRRAKAATEDEVRTWLRKYCADHEEDDPDATHVQVLKNEKWSFLTGGSLVPREEFLH
jgi:hypothetical protein